MRSRFLLAALVLSVPRTPAFSQHLSPVVDLLDKGKPVFGLYAPANRRARPGAPVDTTIKVKTPDELALDAIANKLPDYIFDGSMEGNFDAGYERFAPFVAGMQKGGAVTKKQLHHPLFVKMTEIGTDYALAGQRIAKQLDLGVSGIVFVGVESAEEVKAGLAAMRFKSKGGTRPDAVGGDSEGRRR